MGKELQLRQGNFESFSTANVLLRPQMGHEEAKDIWELHVRKRKTKTRVWYVRMPGLLQAKLKVPDLVSPVLHWLDDEEADLSDYLADPTEPVLCVPSQDNDQFWRMKLKYRESMYGEPGSTMNYWQLSVHSERLTLGMKMHSTAAFLSMPNENGVVLGGTTDRGFNDNSARGYPTWLTPEAREPASFVH